MAKLCNEGENALLEVFLAGGTRGGSGNLYLGLYTDLTEPGETANLASITELTEGANGYDRIALPDANWTVVDDEATHEEQTFTASGGDWGNVTGYFITDAVNGTSGNLILVEQFSDGPYDTPDGLSILVTPTVMAA
jgi:hypothetical protein